MDTGLKKQIAKFKRQAKRDMISRHKRYTEYCQLFASIENEEIRKVYEFFEKDAAAYMAPAILSFASCKLTPQMLKDKDLDFFHWDTLIDVSGDVMNASILHAIRILLDRTSFYMHAAYNDCEIGNGIGSIEKKIGVMNFIDRQLNTGIELTEKEIQFFKYLLNEYNEWLHKVMQVDNKIKHNISTYDLYEIGDIMQPVILPSAKGYYNDKKLKKEKEIPIGFESEYISRAYDLFDKTLEFTTVMIISK